MGKYEVCPRCEGEGTHVNPAVDGHGITADEMDELGEDFREDYIAGVYDVACSMCKGKRVVTTEDKEAYESDLADEALMRAESGAW